MRDKIIERLRCIRHDISLLLQYSHMKINASDIHGAIDALMDVRDLEAEIKALEEMLSLLPVPVSTPLRHNALLLRHVLDPEPGPESV